MTTKKNKFAIEYNLENPSIYYLTVSDVEEPQKTAIFCKYPEKSNSWYLHDFTDDFSEKEIEEAICFLKNEIGLKVD